ncbi:Uncharacterised protein [Legionella moravica]|uniref:Uncharacterized protein n=1 Tax=Legionella moravica TaxID=39962 RepID=A0A378K0I7_9GAMM|nr:Uncharacterised protein [Legionella moravica]
MKATYNRVFQDCWTDGLTVFYTPPQPGFDKTKIPAALYPVMR